MLKLNRISLAAPTLICLLVVSLTLSSCGVAGSFNPDTGAKLAFGTSFVVGTDAPLASVLAFRVTFTGLSVSDGTNSASLLSQPQDVEFARLNGLRTLLDLRQLPAGSYTSVTATLSSPVITYLDTSASPPGIGTMNGTLLQSSVTVPLRTPLVVSDGGLVGLFMDFRLADSLERNASGQLTGNVTPRIIFRPVQPEDTEAEIDELRGGVSSVNVAGGSFVMQGPHGILLTVNTDQNTEFEPGEDLASLNSNTIVDVSGKLQRGTHNLLATSVQIVSQDRFVLGGLITDVRPPSGRADQFDLLVRTELPDLPNAQPGRITTLDLDSNERFMIHHFRLPVAAFLFNRFSLTPGQRVSAGGALVTTATPQTLDVRRVTLHRQGLEGGWVVGSTQGTAKTGTFQFRAAGLVGVLFSQAVTVSTGPRTRFVNLTDLGDLTGSAPIPLRVVGLVLQDPLTGQTVIVAWAVEKLVPPTP